MVSHFNFEDVWNVLPEAIGIMDVVSKKIVFANKAFQVQFELIFCFHFNTLLEPLEFS